jgi:hypothetical protein
VVILPSWSEMWPWRICMLHRYPVGEANEREGEGCDRPRGETPDPGGTNQGRAWEGNQE